MHVETGPWKVVCFDLDGTLVRGTSTSQHLADLLGYGAVIQDLEDKWHRGQISNRDFANAEARYFAGLPLSRLSTLLDDLPLIDGFPETVAALRDRGIHPIISTVAWRFAARVISERFGFADTSGVEMSVDHAGCLTGRVERHFEEGDKISFVKAHCQRHGVSMSQAIAIGDGRSDIPLFGQVGFAVALNATPQAKAAASLSIDTNWLPEILQVVPDL